MIMDDHQRILWPSARRVGVRSPEGVLFWDRCIKHLHCFTFNVNSLVKMVPIPTIFTGDPVMR